MGESKIVFPKGNYALRGDTVTAGNTAHRVLAVGQKLAAGTATSGELQEQLGNNNSWDTLFGEKSMLAATVRAFKGTLSAPLNRATRIDAIGLDDNAGGTEASGNVTFTGGPVTVGASGSVVVIIGSSRFNSYELVYEGGDNVTSLGDDLVTLITADSKAQASGVNTAGDVALTAEHKGSVGNGIGIKVVGSIPGVTIAVTAMTGGAGEPTLTTLFDPVVTERYQTIIYPANWGFTTLTDFLDARFNTTGPLLDGVGITALVDTEANLKAAANAENSESLLICGDNKVDDTQYKGPAIFELPYETAGYFAGIRALRLTEGINISNFIVGEAGLDAFGGTQLSSRPYANTPFPYSSVIPTGKGFTQTQIEALNDSGITVRGNNRAGNGIISGQAVTAYKTDAAGNPDPSFKFLNYVDCGVAFRELTSNNLAARYPQARLTDGDLLPGIVSVNADALSRFYIEMYALAATADFALTRSGEANLTFFRENLTVTLDLANGKATTTMSVPILTQFRENEAVIKIKITETLTG